MSIDTVNIIHSGKIRNFKKDVGQRGTAVNSIETGNFDTLFRSRQEETDENRKVSNIYNLLDQTALQNSCFAFIVIALTLPPAPRAIGVKLKSGRNFGLLKLKR